MYVRLKKEDFFYEFQDEINEAFEEYENAPEGEEHEIFTHDDIGYELFKKHCYNNYVDSLCNVLEL